MSVVCNITAQLSIHPLFSSSFKHFKKHQFPRVLKQISRFQHRLQMQIHKNISECLPARDQRLQNIIVQHTANGLYTETRKVQNSCPLIIYRD